MKKYKKYTIARIIGIILILSLFVGFFLNNKKILIKEKDPNRQNQYTNTEEIINITDDQNQNIKLKWKFIYSGDQTQGDIQTDVSLIVIKNNVEKNIKIGNFQSRVEQVMDFSNRDIPKNTIMMSAGWNGGGDNIAVVKENNNVLIYYEEVVDLKNGPTPEYKLIKSFNLSDLR